MTTSAMKMLNFDHNATSPLRREARRKIFDVIDCVNGNPSSVHHLGRSARRILESDRSLIARLLSVEPKQIIFTSGATESNAMVISGFKGKILVSSTEHSSLTDVRLDIAQASVDETGVVDLDFIDKWLCNNQGPKLVSVMAANNETGVIQPIEEIYTLCKKYDAFFHSDVVQAVGRIPLNFAHFDCISVSAHKLGGLAGVGCVVVNEKYPLTALLKGGVPAVDLKRADCCFIKSIKTNAEKLMDKNHCS